MRHDLSTAHITAFASSPNKWAEKNNRLQRKPLFFKTRIDEAPNKKETPTFIYQTQISMLSVFIGNETQVRGVKYLLLSTFLWWKLWQGYIQCTEWVI